MENIGRVLNVTGAGYADCNGLYTLSNNTRYKWIFGQIAISILFLSKSLAAFGTVKELSTRGLQADGEEKRGGKSTLSTLLMLFQCSAEI